jgi:DNA-binding IclR family transcriptional regulator
MPNKKKIRSKRISHPNLSGSLIKGFKIIELLSEHQEMSVTEVSNRLGMNKSSVHRLLSTLVTLGYAGKNPLNKQYRLTSKLFEIGSRTSGLLTLEEASTEVMERLSEKTLETINLAILDKGEVIYIKRPTVPHWARLSSPIFQRVS